MSKQLIKPNIIFDLGGVLIHWDPDIVYKKFFANDLAKVKRFYEETGIYQANEEMDRGQPFDEALAELASKFPHYREAIYLWKNAWQEMVVGLIAENIKILESLYKQGYPLFALTNWAKETFFPYVRYKYDFFNYFKDIVVSGVERVIKPEVEIYMILLNRNNLCPENCIYIDDNEKNLSPAITLGMSVIHATPKHKLKIQLKNFGIIVHD